MSVLSDDEDFSEFRSRVSDLIKDCVFIVGSSAVFIHMHQQLKATSQWEQIEAALFIMQVTIYFVKNNVGVYIFFTRSPAKLVGGKKIYNIILIYFLF